MSGWEGFFPYYAGYPEAFVERILASSELSDDAVVLDPWNGSGTTTFTAARRGYSAVGIDINPVMIAVAKARLLPSSEADSLVPLGKEILNNADSLSFEEDDPLGAWFETSTAAIIRSIEQGIRGRLIGRLTFTDTGVRIEHLSGIAAALYVTLFATCRDLTRKFRASNPTWMKKPRATADRIFESRENINGAFSHRLSTLTSALEGRVTEKPIDPDLCKIRLDDSAIFQAEDKSVDLVITSPPYCTRIDYTAATRVELAIMSPLLSIPITDLSRQMVGSIRVPLVRPMEQDTWGDKCKSFIRKVSEHQSKASSSYYLLTHLDYFDKMDRSLKKISRILKANGKLVLVVQDSFYKDVHNDLPSIVGEMAENHGLKKLRQQDFRLSRTLAGCHPHRDVYKKTGEAVESVLLFEGGQVHF
jgi:DNA modification methylase